MVRDGQVGVWAMGFRVVVATFFALLGLALQIGPSQIAKEPHEKNLWRMSNAPEFASISRLLIASRLHHMQNRPLWACSVFLAKVATAVASDQSAARRAGGGGRGWWG